MKAVVKNSSNEKKITSEKFRSTEEGLDGVVEIHIEHKPDETIEEEASE